MTVEGSDDRPLSLGVLAQAESPEIVRAALGRFRRRLLVRALILVLVVGTGVFLYPRYFRPDPDLTHEIRYGRGVLLQHDMTEGDLHATITRVTRLSDEVLAPDRHIGRFGLDIFVFAPPVGPNEELIPFLQFDEARGILSSRLGATGGEGGAIEIWGSFISGTRTIDIPFAGVASTGDGAKLIHPTLGTLHIDMTTLGVPDWTWR